MLAILVTGEASGAHLNPAIRYNWALVIAMQRKWFKLKYYYDKVLTKEVVFIPKSIINLSWPWQRVILCALSSKNLCMEQITTLFPLTMFQISAHVPPRSTWFFSSVAWCVFGKLPIRKLPAYIVAQVCFKLFVCYSYYFFFLDVLMFLFPQVPWFGPGGRDGAGGVLGDHGQARARGAG